MRSRYSKYFLSHVLWLKDPLNTYYVQDRFCNRRDMLGITLKTFFDHRAAVTWLRQCNAFDHMTGHKLRKFLSQSAPRPYYQLFRWNDFQVMDEVAHIIMLYRYPVVIRPLYEKLWRASATIDIVCAVQNGEPLQTIFDNDSAFGKAVRLMNSGHTEFLEWLRKDRGQPEVKLKGAVLFEARPPKAEPSARIQNTQWPLYKHSKAGWTDFWTYPKVLANAIIILIKTSLDLLKKALEHPVNELLVEPVKQLVALYKKMADPKKPLKNIVYPLREHRALVGAVIPEWKDGPKKPWPHPEEAEQVLAILIALWIAKKYVDPKMASLRQSATQKVMNSTEKVRGKVKNEVAKTQQHIQNTSADNVGPKTTKKYKKEALKTKGLDIAARRKYLESPDGQLMQKMLKEADPGKPDYVYKSRADDLLKSGKDIPTKRTVRSNEPLYKLVEDGEKPSQYTPYWLTESELAELRKTPSKIADRLGLPNDSVSSSGKYSLWETKPAMGKKPTIFESTVAPTVEGSTSRAGGGAQALILNRQEWQQPILKSVFP